MNDRKEPAAEQNDEPLYLAGTVEQKSDDYLTGMVYGYLVRYGKPELSLKIGAIADGLGIDEIQVCNALDDLKAAGRIGIFISAAIIKINRSHAN